MRNTPQQFTIAEQFAVFPYTQNTPTHCDVSLATGPQPLPKRVLQTVRSSAFSFNFRYLLSLMYSTSCLHLLPRLIVPSVFQDLYGGVYFRCNFSTYLNTSMEHTVFPEESIAKCPRNCPVHFITNRVSLYSGWFLLFIYFHLFLCFFKIVRFFVSWASKFEILQTEKFDVHTKFILKPEVFWGTIPRRMINIFQLARLNNPQFFSLWILDFIKTAGNETNIIITSGFCHYGNAPSVCKKGQRILRLSEQEDHHSFF